jgi:pimeloyl-ACP methyl ester carboxylesterase
MTKARVGKTEIEYEAIGNPESEPLLLIAGLGSQLLAWPDEMCEALSNRGFFVIRFDNRDVGLSTRYSNSGIPDFAQINASYARGERPKVPYTLEDMASDAVGVLDTLHIDKAHVCGASMGGMIAQVLAYKYPSRVLSLAVIMSTTGDPKLPPGKPEVMATFFAPVPTEREAYIEELAKRDRLIYGTFDFDENQDREYRAKEYDRGYYPEGSIRQLAAMAVPGNIVSEIAAIRAPTVVIRGTEDPFYPIEATKEIASTIPGAELITIDGMGHSFPREVLPKILDAISANSKKAVRKQDRKRTRR